MTLSLELRKTAGTGVRITFRAAENTPVTTTVVHYCDGHYLHNLSWAVSELLFDMEDEEEQLVVSEMISHVYGFLETCDALMGATLTDALSWELDWRNLELRQSKKARVNRTTLQEDPDVDDLAAVMENVTTIRKAGRVTRRFLPGTGVMDNMICRHTREVVDPKFTHAPDAFGPDLTIFIVGSPEHERPEWMHYFPDVKRVNPNDLLQTLAGMATNYDERFPNELDITTMLDFNVTSESTRSRRLGRRQCKKMSMVMSKTVLYVPDPEDAWCLAEAVDRFFVFLRAIVCDTTRIKSDVSAGYLLSLSDMLGVAMLKDIVVNVKASEDLGVGVVSMGETTLGDDVRIRVELDPRARLSSLPATLVHAYNGVKVVVIEAFAQEAETRQMPGYREEASFVPQWLGRFVPICVGSSNVRANLSLLDSEIFATHDATELKTYLGLLEERFQAYRSGKSVNQLMDEVSI